MAQEHFYHIKPDRMIGSKLMPLATLAEMDPELADEYVGKYKARPETKSKQIAELDANWDEVLFMSCLNPIVIFQALELLGLYDRTKPASIYRFPAKVLKGMQFVWYQEENKHERFKRITTAGYKETRTLPKETMRYFIDCSAKGEDPLVFSGVPHLLVKGSLDTKLADVISFQGAV